MSYLLAVKLLKESLDRMELNENAWLPDWRDKNSYNIEKKLRLADYNHKDLKYLNTQYAWEFLRRNKTYQNDYKNLWEYIYDRYGTEILCKAIPLEDILSLYKCNPPNIEKIIPYKKKDKIKYLKKNSFNVRQILSPTEYMKKKFSLGNYIPSPDQDIPFYKKDGFELFSFINCMRGSQLIDNNVNIPFNLSLPIKPQVERTQKILIKHQKMFLQVTDSKVYNAEIKKFTSYGDNFLIRQLRILDARNYNVPFKEIAKNILPERFGNDDGKEDEIINNIRKSHVRASINTEIDYPLIAYLNK